MSEKKLAVDRSRLIRKRLKVVRRLDRRCRKYSNRMREFRTMSSGEFVSMTLDDVTDWQAFFIHVFDANVLYEGAVRSAVYVLEKTFEDNVMALSGTVEVEGRGSKESREAAVCEAYPEVAKLREDMVEIRSVGKMLGVTGMERHTRSRGILKILNSLEQRADALSGGRRKKSGWSDEEEEE